MADTSVRTGPPVGRGTLAEMAGVPRATIRHWVDAGILRPQNRSAPVEIFDPTEQVVARVLAGSRRLRLDGSALGRVASQLRRNPPPVGSWVVVDDLGVVENVPRGELEERLAARATRGPVEVMVMEVT